MPTVRQVFLDNLAKDFRAIAGNKLVNESILGGGAAPTAPPPEPLKAWLWLNTTTKAITHYWDAIASAWIAFSVPVTTHTASWNKSTGLQRQVNGVLGNISIPSGTPTDYLGYDAGGNPVYYPLTRFDRVNEIFRTLAASQTTAIVGPDLSVPGMTIWTVETLIEVTAAAVTVTLKTVPPALSPSLIGVEFDVKAVGSWTGSTNVVSESGATIDGLAAHVISKPSAASQPSRSFRWTGSKWLVV